MTPFWEGFSRVWGSRLAVDTWILTTGFAIGVQAARGQWAWAAVYAVIAVLWLHLSRFKQRQGTPP